MKYAPWLVVLVVGFFWFKAHDARVAADTLAKQRGEQLTVAIAQRDSARLEREAQRAERAKGDSLHRAELAKLTATLAIEQVESGRLVARLQTHLAADTSISDTLRSLVTQAVAGLRGEIATLEGIVTRQAKLLRSDSLTIAGLDSTVADLRGIQADTEAMWRDAERRARPSLFGKLRTSLPAVVVAVGIVVLLK